MSLFTNDVLRLEDLPRYEEVKTTPVQPRYWKVILLLFGFNFILFGAVVASCSFLVTEIKPFAWLIVAAYVLLMGLLLFFQKKAFRRKSYALRERDVIYRSGILARHTIIIPFNRIQHVGINEGFAARMFNLAQLEIFTAGGSSSDVKIRGLSKTDAEKMREIIMQKIASKKNSGASNEILPNEFS